MGKTTQISWTDMTWNAAIGCARVSEGCRNCYAEQMAAKKFSATFLKGTGPVWGSSKPRHITRDDNWKLPPRWAKKARRTGTRLLVFGNSLYDIFEDHPTINAIRPRIWQLVDETRDRLIWQFLTKRPERISRCLPHTWACSGSGRPYWDNVWLGTSVESATHADRVNDLLAIDADVRFLSVEPALGPVADSINTNGLHWLIWGGESGKNFRPADHQWARDLLRVCRTTATAFFFKQSAAYQSGRGTTLDGKEYKEFPVPRSRWER